MHDLDEHIVGLISEFYENLEDDTNFLEQEILNLSERPGSVRQTYAKVHSIKGSSGALGLDFISTVCHIFEDHLNHIGTKIPGEQSELFLNFIDLIRDYRKAAITGYDVNEQPFRERLNSFTQHGRRLRFLVAQNTKSFLRRYKQILEGNNIDFSTAKNGYEALGRLLKEHFDVLLIDSQLELIDGSQLTSIIKKVKPHNPDLKVILVSSNEDLTLAKAGHPDFLVYKNIDYFSNIRKIFTDLCQNIIIPGNQPSTEPSNYTNGDAAPANFEISPLKNLICIDDDRLIQSLTKASIKSMELNSFKQAYTGEEGVIKVLENPADLILLDYMLPDIDGPQVLEEIRYKNIETPVVFLTGKNSKSDIEELMKLGAIGVIKKPFDPKALASTINSIWEKYCHEQEAKEELSA